MRNKETQGHTQCGQIISIGQPVRKTLIVELGIDFGRNSLNFGSEFLLNLVEVVTVLVGDQVHCQAQVAEAAGPSNAVQVGFGVLGEVKVDDDIYRLDVNASCQKICWHCFNKS